MVDLTDILKIANEAHGSQMYGDKPYLYHLLAVCENWEEFFLEGTQKEKVDLFKISCILHDILEDTEVTVDELRKEGVHEEVLNALVLLTKEEGYNYEEYIKRICKDEVAWQVKVADTYHNLTSSIQSGELRRMTKYTTQLQLLFSYKAY